MAESNPDLVDEEMDSEGSFLQKRYGWYVVVNRVTENDITKHEAIYEKKLIEVLNQVSFLFDYEKEQIKMMKKQTKTL
jgi:hypothetical protein